MYNGKDIYDPSNFIHFYLVKYSNSELKRMISKYKCIGLEDINISGGTLYRQSILYSPLVARHDNCVSTDSWYPGFLTSSP